MSNFLAIIPTLDEELHAEPCVRSAVTPGPVFVVDRDSTDGTPESVYADVLARSGFR